MKLNFERWGETILGAIVAVVAIGFFAFAAAQSGNSGGGRGYDLVARFQNVSGIAVGSDVRMYGVKVGVVKAIGIDPTTPMARLTLTLNNGIEVLDDSTARVMSDGLLGGAYVSIEPTGFEPLAPGGEIPNTQSAVDLLTLFASFAQNSGQNSTADDAQGTSP